MKPTAVIDKTVFQRICALPETDADAKWNIVEGRFKIVVPLTLLEEVAVDIGTPDPVKPPPVSQMLKRLASLRGRWLEDVRNLAFRELVKKERIENVRLPDTGGRLAHLILSLDHQNLRNWAIQQRQDRESDMEAWRVAQQQILDRKGLRTAGSVEEFFHQHVSRHCLAFLSNDAEKRGFLEGVLGHAFLRRFPEAKAEIHAAFENYTLDNFKHYPRTHDCLVTRLCYFLAPVITIAQTDGSSPRKLIKMGKQTNSTVDEEYVVSALMFDRLITGDSDMRNIMGVFEQIGYWKGRTNFINPNESLDSELSQKLI